MCRSHEHTLCAGQAGLLLLCLVMKELTAQLWLALQVARPQVLGGTLVLAAAAERRAKLVGGKRAPELPPPMTMTRLPTNGLGVRYSCECETLPVNLPLNLGQRGSQW